MKKVFLFFIILINLVSCQNGQNKPGQDKPVVTVSILPQKYFVEKIAGTQVKVNVMVPTGASPVTYEPTPGQMKELAMSKAYFRIGHIGFEKAWMKKLQDINPGMEIINLPQNIELEGGQCEHHHHHEHDGHHHHHGIDPHIWLSPVEVKKQAETIYQYFLKNNPENKQLFENNYKQFCHQIDSLNSYIKKQLEPLQGKKILIFHPALTYFARDYGLQQISIEIDGKEPAPANIREVIQTAQKENIKIVFVQKEFSTHNAEVIAKEIGGSVVQINPLDENWEQSMLFITHEIVKSYLQN